MTDLPPEGDDTAAAVERLREYVSAGAADAAYVLRSWQAAQKLVTQHVGGAAVPADVLDRAVLEVGADLFYRRSTRNGIASFADADLNPYRITRDPLAAGRDLLRPYLSAPVA